MDHPHKKAVMAGLTAGLLSAIPQAAASATMIEATTTPQPATIETTTPQPAIIDSTTVEEPEPLHCNPHKYREPDGDGSWTGLLMKHTAGARATCARRDDDAGVGH